MIFVLNLKLALCNDNQHDPISSANHFLSDDITANACDDDDNGECLRLSCPEVDNDNVEYWEIGDLVPSIAALSFSVPSLLPL